jgi:threonine dehydrogenase-like Zn-dependent dehydrogenase
MRDQPAIKEIVMGKTGLQLRSVIKASGELEIELVDVPTPEPGADEVVVRIEATPINPSDLGLLTGSADLSTIKASGNKDRPIITAKVPETAMPAMAGRLDLSMPIGFEGAGIVISTGSSRCSEGFGGQDSRDVRRWDVCAISLPENSRLPSAA